MFVQFSLDQTFTPALSDSTTGEYQNLARKCTGELNRISKKNFGNGYSRSILNSFRSGSVVANTTLVFQNASVRPPIDTALQLLRTELSNSTVLNVLPGTVAAQSSGRSLHHTILPMSILTLVLLFLTQLLADV